MEKKAGKLGGEEGSFTSPLRKGLVRCWEAFWLCEVWDTTPCQYRQTGAQNNIREERREKELDKGRGDIAEQLRRTREALEGLREKYDMECGLCHKLAIALSR